MTKWRVVIRVFPGTLHFKSLQENHRRLKTKAGDAEQVTLEIRDKRLRDRRKKNPNQTKQLNLVLITNWEEFHS